MKYKEGDKVRVRSKEWYDNNKSRYNDIECGNYMFYGKMSYWCGKVVNIQDVYDGFYRIREDGNVFKWTDEMIKGLVEEETKPKYEDEVNGEYHSTPQYLVRPSGYQFVDENGNVINATKIVLEKKKKEYPKTFLACCDVLNIGNIIERGVKGYKAELFDTLQKLYICRDAYWLIAGKEMGLSEPWKPDWKNGCYVIFTNGDGLIERDIQFGINAILAFPTEEMRDAFKENFDPDIEICKELL